MNLRMRENEQQDSLERIVAASGLIEMNYREVTGTAVMGTFNVAEKLIYQQEAEKSMRNPRERRQRFCTIPKDVAVSRQFLRSFRWWPGTESNRRRQPFQGCALPTELPGQVITKTWWEQVRLFCLPRLIITNTVHESAQVSAGKFIKFKKFCRCRALPRFRRMMCLNWVL